MKSTDISMPKSSPATLVNRVIIEEALNMARRNSIKAVHTHTLLTLMKLFIHNKLQSTKIRLENYRYTHNYHAAQAK